MIIYIFVAAKKTFTGIKVSNRFSKVFDCIVHDLLRAKLRAYGFDYNSVNWLIASEVVENSG